MAWLTTMGQTSDLSLAWNLMAFLCWYIDSVRSSYFYSKRWGSGGTMGSHEPYRRHSDVGTRKSNTYDFEMKVVLICLVSRHLSLSLSPLSFSLSFVYSVSLIRPFWMNLRCCTLCMVNLEHSSCLVAWFGIFQQTCSSIFGSNLKYEIVTIRLLSIYGNVGMRFLWPDVLPDINQLELGMRRWNLATSSAEVEFRLLPLCTSPLCCQGLLERDTN